jgi:hypothetical protein
MREREREREREKERALAEDRERAAQQERAREAARTRRVARSADSTPTSHPHDHTLAKPVDNRQPAKATTRHTDYYNIPGYAGPPYDSKRHIEVLNRPGDVSQSAVAEPLSVMQQVVPSREPRPYGYKTANQDYAYQPRDKRPRMDSAVEEQAQAHAQRRESTSKPSKRKKDDDKLRSPPPKDWSKTTIPVKQYPEVTSGPVEAWLKTVPDLDRVIGRDVYTGNTWTVAGTRLLTPESEPLGGQLIVRIGPGFLGKGCTLRGDAGWDGAIGWTDGAILVDEQTVQERKIWGTDVYTDDSDLGLMLLHANWVRWDREGGREIGKDALHVKLRIVPALVRYTATERNGVDSRGWGNGHDGYSVVIEGVERVNVSGILGPCLGESHFCCLTPPM